MRNKKPSALAAVDAAVTTLRQNQYDHVPLKQAGAAMADLIDKAEVCLSALEEDHPGGNINCHQCKAAHDLRAALDLVKDGAA